MKKINISSLFLEKERLNIIESNFNKNGLELCIEYPSIFDSSKILRDFIVNISNFFNFKGTLISRLTLIVDELNNNAIEYGSLKYDINKMFIKIIFLKNNIQLILEVVDSGKGLQAKTSKEMIILRNKKKLKGFFKNNGIRGRGLFMITEKIVDKLYFKDSTEGGLIVGISKIININN